jgi:cell division protein ZapA
MRAGIHWGRTNMTKFCTIQLLNKSYKIKCPDDEVDNLRASAQKLNQHLCQNKNAFKSLNEFQSLLLAALNISHELICSETQQIQQRQKLSHFIDSLDGHHAGPRLKKRAIEKG